MKYAVVFTFIAVIVFIGLGPSDGQINYSTGTIRYRKCYIPYNFETLGRYSKEWESLKMPDRWGIVVRYPLKSSNNTDGMVRHFVNGISIWTKYDYKIASEMANDLVKYIDDTECEHGLPQYSTFYSSFAIDFSAGKLKNAIKEWDDMGETEEEKRIIQIIKERG